MSWRNFALPPLGKAPVVFALALGALVPAGIAVAMVMQAREARLAPEVALMLQAFASLVVLAFLLPMWRRQVAFDGRALRVRATFYTREAALPEFDLAAARVVDLRERDDWRPRLKTNGFHLPGLQAGHFRLRDRRKAFCLVTDPARVLVLPHRDGTTWLLSFEHPQAVLDILRRAAA